MLRPGWIAVGAGALLGALWDTMNITMAAELHGAVWSLGIMALGSALIGALLVLHAPLKPWREPVLAILAGSVFGIVATGLSVGFGRVADRLPHAIGQTALLCAAAAAGGAIVRKWFSAARATVPATALLAGLVASGLLAVVVVSSAHAAGDVQRVLIIVAIFAAPFTTAFAMQMLIEDKRIWACGGGMLVMIASSAIRGGTSHWDASALTFIPIAWGIAALGALLAWKYRVRRGRAGGPHVPPAHIQT